MWISYIKPSLKFPEWCLTTYLDTMAQPSWRKISHHSILTNTLQLICVCFILYSVTSLFSLLSSPSFFCLLLEIFCVGIEVLRANRDSFLFPVFTLFISFSCFLPMGLLVLCWIWVVGLGILPLFPTLKIEIQCFTTKYDVYCRVFVNILYQVEEVTFYSLLKTIKIMNAISASFGMIVWLFSLLACWFGGLHWCWNILLSCGVV